MLSIPAYNRSKFESKIESLNKKAEKLGLKPTQYSIIREYQKKFINEWNTTYFIDFIDINIESHEIKVGNYTFLGTIDHSQENGTFVNPVPGKSIPQKYFDSPNHCDHCNINRYRTETFIFEDKGETKQVGRTCLKEFFGIDPEQELNHYQRIATLSAEFDEENFSSGARGYEYFDMINILSIGLALSKDFGYISSKMSEETDKPSTNTQVLNVLFPNNHPNSKAFSKHYHTQAENYNNKAQDIIAWAISHFTSNTEFDHNISNVIKSETISEKYFGYLLCLIALHHKHTESQSNTNITNEYFGKEKDKISLNLTCKSIYQTESYYGFTTIISFISDSGHIFVWYASGAHDEFTKGESYTIKATIKGHKEYKGTKQTIITRAKVI